MRAIISLSACVLILGATTAVAGQDPVETTSPTQAQPTSAPQPSPTTTTSSTTTPAAPSATPPSAVTTSQPAAAPVSKEVAERADAEKRLIAAGYKLHVGKDGQRTFCRRETPLGSHFETKVCGTPEQLADATQNSKYLTDKILRIDNNPPGIGTNVAKGY